MAKKQNVNIRLVNLNNKSRKGTYVYAKAKGQRGQYYKWDEDAVIDAYKQYYKDKYIAKKQKGTIKEYKEGYTKKYRGEKTPRTRPTRQAEQYLRKIKRTPTINQAIKRGITTSNIPDALRATQAQIKQAKKDILKNLVADPELLELLTLPENMNKLKHRLEYRVEFKDQQGKTLATVGTFNKTPEEVVNELKKTIVEGEEIDHTKTPTLARKLEQLKTYTKLNIKEKGKVKRAFINIVFRKGK